MPGCSTPTLSLLKLTYLSAQTELEAHLWICFRYLYVFWIFRKKKKSDIFFTKKKSIEKKYLRFCVEIFRFSKNRGKSNKKISRFFHLPDIFWRKDTGFMRFISILDEPENLSKKYWVWKKLGRFYQTGKKFANFFPFLIHPGMAPLKGSSPGWASHFRVGFSNFKVTYLSTQTELGAHLWICYRSWMKYFFWRNNISIEKNLRFLVEIFDFQKS